ncbi:MgtC/SapB family protein [Helcobacillus massiliensis]|uniref:Putative Mg2+ transporter-C (MgtC) family protein n=1 Tax=Helcobacillus massiliensis TaxID=521392 RepID=A0A839QZF0_9MICO|nr:putative Mg2+ transporter-C (MgtC) family protein [Helcobacillus massiliensis]
MQSLVGFTNSTNLIEVQLVLASFFFCSLIGIERQVRQKAAGYRTNVLVGMGSCAFTLISAYGFAMVLGNDVTLDPSRISAQIVSGIGFLGAGVIFKGRNVVRGLTTAATVWVSAAVGMACGAGMLSLAAVVTFLHLFTLFVVAPIVKRIPDPDRKRQLFVSYRDGEGVLRDVRATATDMGFSSSIICSRRIDDPNGRRIDMDIQFHGQRPQQHLMAPLMEVDGVLQVSIGTDSEGNRDDDEAD